MKIFRKNIILTLLFGILLVFILCFSDMAKEYSFLGLSVWFEQMIPSLLPFMILSTMLVRLNLDEVLIKPVKGILKAVYRISDGGIYVLVMGFLCGFPMGAKTAVMEYEAGKITKKEAEFLLAFTNNIGPAYFLSFVYGNIYRNIPLWKGLAFIYGLPLLYGILLRYSIYQSLPVGRQATVKKNCDKTPAVSFLSVMDESINSGLSQIAMLGGYMVVCNLLVIIPKILFASNARLCAFCHNLLEISGGLLAIESLHLSPETAFACAHISLAFTGLSCHLQTFHLLGHSGLSRQKYMLHKLILCSIAIMMLYIFMIR